MTWQPAAVLTVDAEAWATDYLRAALAGRDEDYAYDVYVSNTVPKPRRDRMVIVRRDGGTLRDVFDQPRLAIRTWAENDADATDLAALVGALLRIAPGDGTCTAVRQMSGVTTVPDESKQALRYQLFEVDLRAGALTA